MERRIMLSPRLKAIAAMVEAGSRLADIGTDHGYLPIWLLEAGKIPSAIAMDVREGPLLRARAHVEEHGLSDRIKLRLSDGFSALSPGEADGAVIAGMGGPLTVRILEGGKKVAKSLRYLVLSPQSEILVVRRYLLEQGYGILSEDMILDEGKYYTVMKATYGKKGDSHAEERPWNRMEERYGRHLLCSGKSVVLEFLLKEKHTRAAIRETLLLAETDRAKKRLFQVEEELKMLDMAISVVKEKCGSASQEAGKTEESVATFFERANDREKTAGGYGRKNGEGEWNR